MSLSSLAFIDTAEAYGLRALLRVWVDEETRRPFKSRPSIRLSESKAMSFGSFA